MSEEPIARLSGDQVLALKFAAHRQLARWSSRPQLSRHQHAQRTALARAARILQDRALAHGCELRAAGDESIRADARPNTPRAEDAD